MIFLLLLYARPSYIKCHLWWSRTRSSISIYCRIISVSHLLYNDILGFNTPFVRPSQVSRCINSKDTNTLTTCKFNDSNDSFYRDYKKYISFILKEPKKLIENKLRRSPHLRKRVCFTFPTCYTWVGRIYGYYIKTPLPEPVEHGTFSGVWLKR